MLRKSIFIATNRNDIYNKSMDIDLSVVIPCLNEEKTIGTCIEKCKKVFAELGINGEVVVSDNGSTDNSVSISESLGARVVHCKDKGYGNALRFGFKNALGNYIIMGDADNTYDYNEIPIFWKALTPDIDMVIGTRLRGYIEKSAMPFLHRYLGTPVLTMVLNILYGTRISDIMCGMRLMKRESLEKINLKTTGMEFASELMVEFAKHKFKIKEVKISLKCGAKGRKPHLNTWRDGWRHLCYLVKERFV